MTLAGAIASFVQHLDTSEDRAAARCSDALLELQTYSDSARLGNLSELTAPRVRDFASRWYVERAVAAKTPRTSHPAEFTDCLMSFFLWASEYARFREQSECVKVLLELRNSLPRAIEISAALGKHVQERGGPFAFPEFLNTFEGGGRSPYDLDAPGEVGALEGYFEVARIDGTLVEAQELISATKVWPIRFPEPIARLLGEGFVINLELIRTAGGWEIAGCGCAYPPGTEF